MTCLIVFIAIAAAIALSIVVRVLRRRASSPAAYDNETVRHRAYYKHW